MQYLILQCALRENCYIAIWRAECAEDFDLLLPLRNPQADTLMILKICFKP